MIDSGKTQEFKEAARLFRNTFPDFLAEHYSAVDASDREQIQLSSDAALGLALGLQQVSLSMLAMSLKGELLVSGEIPMLDDMAHASLAQLFQRLRVMYPPTQEPTDEAGGGDGGSEQSP